VNSPDSICISFVRTKLIETLEAISPPAIVAAAGYTALAGYGTSAERARRPKKEQIEKLKGKRTRLTGLCLPDFYSKHKNWARNVPSLRPGKLPACILPSNDLLFYLCSMARLTKGYLSKLEDLVSEGGFMVRYERGNFKSGYCILKENRLVLINNFLPLDGRINTMMELAVSLGLNEENLSDKSRKLLAEIRAEKLTVQTEIVFESSGED
jgi:hypothetical protein